MLYPFDYFIIIIFLFFLLSQFYIFYIVQFLFIRSDVKQILKSTKLFFLCSEKNSLFLFPSIFVDIFLFPFIFISCWCNLFYLLKYLKYNQINRKIHGETSISTRPWRSNIDRVFLSNSCFRFWRFPFRNSFQIFHRFASKQIFWQRWIVLRVYYCNCRNTSVVFNLVPPLPIFVSHFTLFRSIRFRFYYFCIIHRMNKCIKTRYCHC